MYTPTHSKLDPVEGLTSADIIELFESFDRGDTLDDVLDALEERLDYSIEFHVEHSGDQCWEHPIIIESNDGAHILSKYFFTLYRRDVGDNTIFTLTTGRIGNTIHRCWLVTTS